MSKETLVYRGEAQWSRRAELKLVDDRVVFDCSDGEYGPIEFDIETLKRAIMYHEDDDIALWDATLLDGLDDE
jgi:hypothetical protein